MLFKKTPHCDKVDYFQDSSLKVVILHRKEWFLFFSFIPKKSKKCGWLGLKEGPKMFLR